MCRWIVLNDEVWGKQLREYVRSESVKKGEKNMTVESFAKYVNGNILPEVIRRGEDKGLPHSIRENGICLETARFWLHYIGCYFKQGKKDVYFDGHEREDVVLYREKFIPRFIEYLSDPNFLVVVQDESIYRSNEHNNFYWQVRRTGEHINTVLRQKGLGSGTMVSGFISVFGFVALTDEEMSQLNAIRASKGLGPITLATRVTNEEVDGAFGPGVEALTFSYHLFNYGKNKEGYWDGEKMAIQTEEIISMFEFKFPGQKLVLLFDWSSGHDKKPLDSVILGNIRLNWGGKQPLMRATVLLEDYGPTFKSGDTQHLVFQDGDEPPFYDPNAVNFVGKPKGAKQIAYERSLWRPGMVLKDETDTSRSIFHALNKCSDFHIFIKSILQELIEGLGHCCDFLPKFHCELSPIERVWAKSKKYVRNFSDDTRDTMLKNIRKSFCDENLPSSTIAKYFGKVYRYALGYQKGDGLAAQMCKKYKSHRAVPASEAFA